MNDFLCFFLVLRQIVEQGNGNAPALAAGFVAACLPEGRDGIEPLKAGIIRLQNFAAPDGTVGAVAGAVKGHANYRFVVIVFGHAGENMGIVVLDRKEGQPQFLGDGYGIVAGMHIAGHDLRLAFEQCGQPPDGFAQSLHGAQIAHITHIRGGIEDVVAAHAEGIFELTANAEHCAVPVIFQHKGQGCIATAAANHIGLAVQPVHHGVIRANANLAVV